MTGLRQVWLTTGAIWSTLPPLGSSDTGNGTVSYSVVANTDTIQRTGTMTIAGQTLTVTQQGISWWNSWISRETIAFACTILPWYSIYMTTKLTDEMRLALVQHPDGPIAVEDDRTQRLYENVMWAFEPASPPPALDGREQELLGNVSTALRYARRPGPVARPHRSMGLVIFMRDR